MWKISWLTRDGTAEPVSRDQILRRERGQETSTFLVQLTTSRIGNHTRLIHTLMKSVDHRFDEPFRHWSVPFLGKVSHSLSSCNPPRARKKLLVITFDDFVGWTVHQTVFSVACNSVCMYVCIYVSMYVCMVITYSRVWVDRVRLPILLVVS